MATNKTEQLSNPYLDGKREWMERYGSFIQSKKKWQGIAIFSLGLAAVATLGALSLAKQSKFVPYVVELDKLGRVSATSFPSQELKAEPKMIRAALAGWVQKARAVSSDGQAQRQYLEQTFACAAQSDPAFFALTQFMEKNWKRGADETVSIEIVGDPLPVTAKTWQVEWWETVSARTGKQLRRELWRGNFELYFSTPQNPKTLLVNPLGMFVKEYNWSLQRIEPGN